MFFISMSVILYQMFFIALLVVGGLIGRKTLLVLAALSLVWTTTHLFFLPLAVFQSLVIVGTTLVMNHRIDKKNKKKRPRRGAVNQDGRGLLEEAGFL